VIHTKYESSEILVLTTPATIGSESYFLYQIVASRLPLTIFYQINGGLVLLRIENIHNNLYCFGMEKRMLTVELAVDQHTKICERLDRSMSHLCQAMADLRVQMIQGQAELRHEIALVQADLRKEIAFVQTDLRKEIAFVQTDLRQEIARSNADLHKFFERKFMWMMTAYCGGMFTLLGFLGKYLLDSYAR